MATGKRYYWIKLKESFMTSDAVDYLMSQTNGANYVVLYQMLCLKTINTDGKLTRQIGEVLIPYDVEKIQRDCKWFTLDTVRVALSLFRALGLIYEDNAGTLVLADHQNLVGSEMDWAEQKRRQRMKQANAPQLPDGQGVDNGVDNVHTEIREEILDIRDTEFRDTDEEIEGDFTPQAEQSRRPPPCPYQKIMELFNRICVSYPRIESIDGNRKKAVSARWRSYGDISVFEQLFTKAQASSFLKGSNKRNWSATFDWLMKADNMSKTLEGNYDEKPTSSQPSASSGALGVLAKLREECGDD